MAAPRKVVIVGSQPGQVLDVTGPIEVFSNAKGYDITIATPGPRRTLETNRRFALSDAVPITEITGPIDTLIIAGSRDGYLRSLLCNVDRRRGKSITACGLNLHGCFPAPSGWAHQREESGDTLAVL